MPDSTTTLVQRQLDRLKAGDDGARDELISRACARLGRLARRILNDHPGVVRFEDSDDLLQRCVLRLMRSLESRPPCTSADFFRLAALEMRHTLVDLARHYFGPLGAGANEARAVDCQPSQSGDPGVGRAAAEPAARCDSFDPVALSYWAEFHRAVEQLSAEHRAVFDLLWYHELTNEEAAQLLTTSVSTIKRRWLEARLELQEHFPSMGVRS
jgi:RNA polymerase sigma-70 factor (ECF subfamily)